MRSYADLVRDFTAGRCGASVRALEPLRGRKNAEVHHLLVQSGFAFESRPLTAERGPTGAPRWRLADGRSTSDPTDPSVVMTFLYAHPDRGLVRIFPAGDPWGRWAPPSMPSAIRCVLFAPPVRRADAAPRGVAINASFYNEAFRVSDDGSAIPKSRRSVYAPHLTPHAVGPESFPLDPADRGIVRLG